jgi:ankyrin repeat protein
VNSKITVVITWIALPVAVMLGGCTYSASDLHCALREGNFEELKSILATKPELVNAKDKDGLSPLLNAVLTDQESVVGLLLANGADVNVKDKEGMTALHWSAYIGQDSIVGLLLANGADVNAKDKEGMTALDWALTGDTVELLRKGGATE